MQRQEQRQSLIGRPEAQRLCFNIVSGLDKLGRNVHIQHNVTSLSHRAHSATSAVSAITGSMVSCGAFNLIKIATDG